MIIVGGTSAASRTPPHDVTNRPSPAKTMASGDAGGTYAEICRPPSYSDLSVTSWPAVGEIGVGSLLVAAAATFVRGLRGGGFFVADPVDVGESAEAAFEDDVEPARPYCCNHDPPAP
jgi:hypothetical protein